MTIEGKNNWPAGIKRTKQRESVLSVLETASEPMNALAICAVMEKGGNAAWLSTVYRTLGLFVEKGMVIKSNGWNNDLAVYELNRRCHKHYAICLNCHKLIAVDRCPIGSFFPALEDEGFHIMGHNMEIYGLCKNCYANAGDCPLPNRAIARVSLP